MLSSEAGRSPGEMGLITDATGEFINVLTHGVATGRNICFRTVSRYKVSYIPAFSFPTVGAGLPRLEISSAGINTLFYATDIEGQDGQKGVIRAVLLPKGPEVGELEVGTERALSYAEIIALTNVAAHPNADLIEQFMLLELSGREQAEVVSKRMQLAIARETMEGESQGRHQVFVSEQILSSVAVVRPGSRE